MSSNTKGDDRVLAYTTTIAMEMIEMMMGVEGIRGRRPSIDAEWVIDFESDWLIVTRFPK
jgi:hypothetical protein